MQRYITLSEVCRVKTGVKPVLITGVKCDTGVTPNCLRDEAGLKLVFNTLVFLGICSCFGVLH